MKKASHQNRAVELKVRPIRAAKWLFLQSFLKIIFIAVLSTAVFWRFLLIPEPYTSNLTYGESVTWNWCPQLVLLHYFAIKVMFKAFSWKHFSIILYGKSQTVLIISWGECMYCGGVFVYEYKPLFFPGSAHEVVIRAAMLFVVQFSVIEYNCSSYWQCLN